MVDLNLGDTQLLIRECKRQGVSLDECAYVLATAKWETAHKMKPVMEAFWLDDNWRRRNLHYYPWHGRGYVQLTWEGNYRRAGEKIGVDLIANPNAAMEPNNAAEIIVSGMKEGWFTGKKLSDYFGPGMADFVFARRIVNGNDKAQAIAAIAAEYVDALRADDYDKPADHEIPKLAKPDLGEPTGWAAFLEWLTGWLAGKGKQ